MNTGKTLFAQLMDFLPWSTFDRIVARYNGNRAVRTLPCAAQYQVMAFAQITYRESLRDTEACLSAQSAKLYHMGLPRPIRGSTLADANPSSRIGAVLGVPPIVYQWFSRKGLHYTGLLGALGTAPVAMRGGGCGGRLSLSCSMRRRSSGSGCV